MILNKRNGQETFRKTLLQRFNNTCVLSNSKRSLEACHIIPFNICKIFDITNGILLKSDLHKEFDNLQLYLRVMQ